MCKELTEEQLLSQEKIEDPNELRTVLEEMGVCRYCSCGKSSESGDHDILRRIQHQMRFRNRLLHILDKIGF